MVRDPTKGSYGLQEPEQSHWLPEPVQASRLP